MHNLDDNAINVFTDGSMKERPRRGGVGYRIVTVDNGGHEVTWDSDLAGYLGATNNEMELQAVILALKHVSGRRPPVDLRRFNKIVVRDRLALRSAEHAGRAGSGRETGGVEALEPPSSTHRSGRNCSPLCVALPCGRTSSG